jgi:hypothetical protein
VSLIFFKLFGISSQNKVKTLLKRCKGGLVIEEEPLVKVLNTQTAVLLSFSLGVWERQDCILAVQLTPTSQTSKKNY